MNDVIPFAYGDHPVRTLTIDGELFRVKETAVTHSDGHVTISKTPKVTGKGQAYFVARFLDGRFSLEGITA